MHWISTEVTRQVALLCSICLCSKYPIFLIGSPQNNIYKHMVWKMLTAFAIVHFSICGGPGFLSLYMWLWGYLMHFMVYFFLTCLLGVKSHQCGLDKRPFMFRQRTNSKDSVVGLYRKITFSLSCLLCGFLRRHEAGFNYLLRKAGSPMGSQRAKRQRRAFRCLVWEIYPWFLGKELQMWN